MQLSSDGVLVLFHDDTLDEKTPRTGAVVEYTAAQLSQTDVGSWFDKTHPEVEEHYAGTRLATLAELFDEFGERFQYHIELKAREEAIPGLVLAEVERRRLAGRVILTSFRHEQLERARRLDPDVRIHLLVRREGRIARPPGMTATLAEPGLLALQRLWIDWCRDAGLDGVAVAVSDLSPEVVAYADERGLVLRAWRVKQRDDMDRAIALGTHGMTLDWPEKLIARLLDALAQADDGR